MDLLGGYGSGSDSEPESPQAAGNTGRATLLAADPPPRQAAPPAAQQPPADPAQLLSALPPPAQGAKAPLFSGLPQPAQKKKVVVQFRCPISFDRSEVKAAEDEEEPASKRRKASTRGQPLAALLPAPKHGVAAGGRRLDVAGKGGRQYDSDDDDVVPGTEDRSGMVDLAPGDAPADGNEAFRVDAAPGGGGAAAAAAAASQYGAAQAQQYAQWQQYYAQHGGHEYNQHQQAAAAAAAAQAADPADAMLAAALAAERERAARRGQAAPAGLEIKEVRGDQLKHMDAAQRASVNAVRNALGADYEAKLRAEAGSDPSKLSKRRHQITSLYHYAKQKELEQLEVRAQGSKTKAETQRKYGW